MPRPDRPLQYPKELMAEVAQSIRSYLDEQWGQYLHLYSQAPDGLTEQLEALVKFAPAHKRAELSAHLSQLHAQVTATYQQFYALADLLDGGQQRQAHTDQHTARGLQIK